MAKEWLDLTLNARLREIANEENVCHFDDHFRLAHNSLCVMMDRVDDSGQWLNRHEAFPSSPDEFLLFLVHSDIVIKTILAAMGKLGVPNPFSMQDEGVSKRYFSKVCTGYPYNISADKMPDDALVWSYIRALAFAHAEETGSKRYHGVFLAEKEIQYSPYPIVDERTQEVGVMVYSNVWEDSRSFLIPYEVLKSFVQSRYNLIADIVHLAEKRVKDWRNACKKEVIDESSGPVNTLRILRDKYAERFGECYAYDFEFPLMCLSCETTCRENDSVVKEFRSAVADVIPAVCDSFRKLDYDGAIKMLDSVCCKSPMDRPSSENYNLQKVYTHLNERSWNGKRDLAIQCAKNLASGFALKYVRINVDEMSDEETLLLITVACYKYRQERQN